MSTLHPIDHDGSPLGAWLQHNPTQPHSAEDGRGLRLAFYARISTREFQDPTSSTGWQRQVATDLIAGHGQIIAEFIDAGCSRRRSWTRRPQTAALLDAITHPQRAFDAVVVGEYERAFCGQQLRELLPVLAAHNIQLWLPEFQGPIDPTDPVHQALMLLLGSQATREVQRSRFRVSAAMRTQVVEQGRYQGGRPPYGYRLADAGPHPKRAHAQWGRRLRRLQPDPETARWVRWIFTQRLTGRSVASIARELNETGVPCPSGADPGRNRHRRAHRWTVRTVASILANPRYTGRQVWNRETTDHATTRDATAGVRRRTDRADWVISRDRAHEVLVSEAEFLAVQGIAAPPVPSRNTNRSYLLAGLTRCQVCGRRMEPYWAHHRAVYRCRHGRTSAWPGGDRRRPAVYQRGDHIIAAIRPHTGDIEPQQIAQRLTETGAQIVCNTGRVIFTPLNTNGACPVT